MYMLQLFDEADALQPVDARLIREGVLRIGRDAGADWPIADPDCALSRTHCELAVSEAGLSLTALGSNGVFDDVSGERLPDAVPVPMPLPSAFRLGRFRIVASQAPHVGIDIDEGGTVLLRPPLGSSTEVPRDWADGAAPAADLGDGSLLEAFCRGAGLDGSQLSGEEPEEIMVRLGAVYRQMVLGIGDLMAERDRARAHYRLTRTTIGGADNNPFKWAPTQRLAVDLLLAEASGFLSGPAALQASFRDVKQHLVATFAGMGASLHAAVDSFAPAALEAATRGQASLLKGRGALHAEEAARRHADLAAQLDGSATGSLDRAFVAAYDAAGRGAA